MSTIEPFKAFRPDPALASQVACVPYDVVNASEARFLAGDNPCSYLRVIRPEIEMDPSTDPYTDEVYRRAGQKLSSFISDGILTQDDEPALYIYRLQMQGCSQTGIFGLTSVDEYDHGLIKVHEKTRADKERDRIRHILGAGAHTEPVFLTYRDEPNLTSLFMEQAVEEPLYDFTADDGIQHTVWKAENSGVIRDAFQKLPCLYIADGHHRAAAASSCRAMLRDQNPRHSGKEPYNYFLSVTFPHNQLRIMPYNRIVKSAPDGIDSVLNALKESSDLRKTGESSPQSRGEACIYVKGGWFSLQLCNGRQLPSDPVEALDVSLLHTTVLAPLFGIGDPRTDRNIDFVGGIRGTAELERLVNNGAAVAAFSMFPVPIEDLFAVADRQRCMAPKSTWFEPKLRSGLLVHKFI